MLGSGGNVGNSDFSAMFAQTVALLFPTGEADLESTSRRRCLLVSALSGSPIPAIAEFAIGQFDPGKAGGANQTQGFEAGSAVNPWDYTLMCEGALVITGSISRRTETGPAGASFPFTVKAANVGFGSAGDEKNRGETWLPLWKKPTRISEIGFLFCEGRAEIAGKPCRTGVDFARAVAMLGVDRGISEFVRCGYQERLGQSYLATPLGRFEVQVRPDADLFCEIDPWLDRFRGAASGDQSPPRFKAALRRIDAAIFDFCKYGSRPRFAEVLCALGRAERELARGERFRKEKFLRPVAGLSPGWLSASADGTPELDVALSLAGLWDPEPQIGPLRYNLEPVRVWRAQNEGIRSEWTDSANAVVWSGADLIENLRKVLERRLMDSARYGCPALPLKFRHSASIEAVSMFIQGDLDDRRIALLIWGLMLVDQGKAYPKLPWQVPDASPLPRSFALLKLLFLPHAVQTPDGDTRVRPEPRLLPLLRAGRAGEACTIAARRLRASGIATIPHARRTTRDREWQGADGGVDPRRLAASLLIPISINNAGRLATMITRPEKA